MKKIIIVLIVIAIGIFGSLAYLEQEDYIDYGRKEKIIEIEAPLARDEKANLVMEHINSLDKEAYRGENAGNIYTNKEGAIVDVTIYGAQHSGFEEHIAKIERILKVEGIKEFIYDDEKNALAIDLLKDLDLAGENGVRSIKNYGDIIVVNEEFKRYEENQSDYINQEVNIIIPRDKIKDQEVDALSQKIKGERYYLKNYIVGGKNEMLVLANQTQLIDMARGSVWLDEEGQVIEKIPAEVRYEILLEGNKVEYIKGIAKDIVKDNENLALQGEDIEVFLNAARELGLDESGLTQLGQIIEETVASPMKNRKEKIGGWQYSAKYSTDSYNMGKVVYLEMTLE